MQACPNCAYRNRPGVVFCENCGTSLIGDSPINTKSIGTKGLEGILPDSPVQNIVGSAASDIFGKGTILKIEISGVEPILLKPKAETIFGRRDPATGAMPDVDLTPFAGYRMGVSRRHATIHQHESEDRLDLIDLGSSNGTFVNSVRIPPNQPHRLRDGDEIRLGQMVMRIFFQPSGQPNAQEGTKPTSQSDNQPPPSDSNPGGDLAKQ
jgi:FHA domain/zinc-ribbon domain